MTITCYFIVSRNERQKKHCLDFFFSPSLRLVMESRNVDPDNLTLVETGLTLLLVPFSPLEGLKGRLFYVTNLSPIYVWLTHWLPCKEAAGGWRTAVSTTRWPWRGCRARGPPAQLVLGSTLPNLFPLMEPRSQGQWHGFG